jgi:hypothetical protein
LPAEVCDGPGGSPGGAPLDIGGSVPLLLELVFISLCSQLFGIEGREEVPDVTSLEGATLGSWSDDMAAACV